MSSLASRMGRNFLKLNKTVKSDFKYLSSVNNPKVNWYQHGTKVVVGGIAVISFGAFGAYVMLRDPKENTTTEKSGITEARYTASGKGRIINDVFIEVGKSGTTLKFTTDFKENTEYENNNEMFKNDEYQFIPKEGSNPMIFYKEDENRSYITVSLSKTSKENAVL